MQKRVKIIIKKALDDKFVNIEYYRFVMDKIEVELIIDDILEDEKEFFEKNQITRSDIKYTVVGIGGPCRNATLQCSENLLNLE